MITRNGTLAQLAQQFAVNEDLIPKNSLGPAIHQRQIATAVWLRTGLSDDQENVPRRYLLSACERVLELKKNVVDQVRATARTLTKEKAEQLELLLQQDRSVQVLMDKTLGASTVVNANNIDSLIDVMKKGLAAEVEQAALEKIATSERESASKVRKANEARRSAERQLSEASASLDQAEIEDSKILFALIDEVNVRLGRYQLIQKLGFALIIILVGMLPLVSEKLDGKFKIAALLVSGALAAIFVFFQIFDKPMGLETRAERWSRARLKTLAERRGLERKLQKMEIQYKARQLVGFFPSNNGGFVV